MASAAPSSWGGQTSGHNLGVLKAFHCEKQRSIFLAFCCSYVTILWRSTLSISTSARYTKKVAMAQSRLAQCGLIMINDYLLSIPGWQMWYPPLICCLRRYAYIVQHIGNKMASVWYGAQPITHKMRTCQRFTLASRMQELIFHRIMTFSQDRKYNFFMNWWQNQRD